MPRGSAYPRGHDDGGLARPGRAHDIAMLSLPRDLIDVPLGNGDVYAPKLNSADVLCRQPPGGVPGGGWPPSGAVEFFSGSISSTTPSCSSGASSGWSMRSAASTSTSSRASDPTYDGYGLEDAAGRSRPVAITWMGATPSRSPGRARRPARATSRAGATWQLEVIVALRDAVTKDGGLLWSPAADRRRRRRGPHRHAAITPAAARGGHR